ncbi:Uncharacterized protein OS=Acetobacter pasteurianus IFO 3283-07 GN=APA07_18750 PE=4 SV=1: DUF262: DUF1524 [Gemmata massiliana]|uniref:DUF262 domain-containing protein n=1 Tax=Gemmata massiliana TaxID=1210884 RepID=A0A6P2CVS4_9BACT|nr:DUF262 domain-containing protein [Gemmata massiliana]VTR91202.1 Uncharacterized protein OS=Acetobacter pasteurianus IFO 3283-07 GN=APA07_18750 PE=4 SV=1: DUF262: DUF1524 [Gemmata massiliana]
MSAKYDVLSQTLELLLSPGTAIFRVPMFQRPYSWSETEVSQLADDIFSPTDKADLPYFLGSIVLAQANNDDQELGEIVLDGQQRLTTLSLLLAVLLERVRNADVPDVDEYAAYLFSRRLRAKRTPKIILQPQDAIIFEHLLTKPSDALLPEIKDTQLGQAIATLTERIKYYASSNPLFAHGLPAEVAMLERLLYEVEIVRISAPSERDAFRLFETLNDRGMALSAADLVKNKILSRCGSDIDEAVELWTSITELTEDDIVGFLRTYWIACHGFVRKNNLYDSYKKHIENMSVSAATNFVADLESLARVYREICAPSSQKQCQWGREASKILARLSDFNARSCRPALLAAAKYRSKDFEAIAKICESIIVRHSVICGRNSSMLEGFYHALAATLRDPSKDLSDIAKLKDFDPVPSNDEVTAAIKKIELVRVSPQWRVLLIRINEHLHPTELVVDEPSRVHVEHIFPQTPSSSALAESQIKPVDVKRYCTKLGNLTLLAGKRNIKISNGPFSLKKDTYATSDIAMTRELCKLTGWNNTAIEKRTADMANAIVLAYPHPREIASEK